MRELTKPEVYNVIAYAKSIEEGNGRKILENFELAQTALAQTIFGILPSVIAEQDQDMAHLFMDLCFDVLCVFEKSFGPLPSQTDMDIGLAGKTSGITRYRIEISGIRSADGQKNPQKPTRSFY